MGFVILFEIYYLFFSKKAVIEEQTEEKKHENSSNIIFSVTRRNIQERIYNYKKKDETVRQSLKKH